MKQILFSRGYICGGGISSKSKFPKLFHLSLNFLDREINTFNCLLTFINMSSIKNNVTTHGDEDPPQVANTQQKKLTICFYEWNKLSYFRPKKKVFLNLFGTS